MNTSVGSTVLMGATLSPKAEEIIALWDKAVTETLALLTDRSLKLSEDDVVNIYQMPLVAAASVHVPGIVLSGASAKHTREAFRNALTQQIEVYKASMEAAKRMPS